MSEVVNVRRELLEEYMTCPLCNKLFEEATTISECLHTFCRKCIYEKLTDEEADCCPICSTDLGCVPVEKLRPDHNIEDVRAKIFPFKRRKVNAPEVAPSISLPVRRKERSLSSLVVSTPPVSAQTSLTRRRTKAVARKAAALRCSNFSIGEPIKKEEDLLRDRPENSSSPETLNKIAQNRRQNSSTAEPSNRHIPNRHKENGAEPWAGKVDLWKPLNCLVEAANITKSQGSVAKSEQKNAPDGEAHMPKNKGKEHVYQSKAHHDKNGTSGASPEVKTRKGRKKTTSSMDQGISAQAVLDATGCKRDKGTGPIWFKLLPSEDQEGDASLPQVPASYLKIKNGNIPVSFIQNYLAKKLTLSSEAEVEIICRGQPIPPTLQLNNLVDLWLKKTAPSHRVQATIGISAKDFVMELAYARKLQHP